MVPSPLNAILARVNLRELLGWFRTRLSHGGATITLDFTLSWGLLLGNRSQPTRNALVPGSALCREETGVVDAKGEGAARERRAALLGSGTIAAQCSSSRAPPSGWGRAEGARVPLLLLFGLLLLGHLFFAGLKLEGGASFLEVVFEEGGELAFGAIGNEAFQELALVAGRAFQEPLPVESRWRECVSKTSRPWAPSWF